jgi:SAM-dependent methyltransferase
MRDLQEQPDREWDEKLGIITAGAGDDSPDTVNFRYEPTPYAVLERLAESGLIGPGSLLLDYGCGRGRCPIFLHARTGCRAIGIDHNPVLIGEAKANLAKMMTAGNSPENISASLHESGRTPEREKPEKAGKAEKQAVTFRRMRAQDYRVTEEDSFYFFNPFSEVILQTVLQEIIGSWYENPRQMYLFFYYPKDEDVALLSMYDEILFYDEIDCTDLYGGRDSRERVLIYEIPSDSDNI